MTAPRQVVAGRPYMFTRRCAERRFYLRPSKETNNAYLYCLAVAAKRHRVDIYWASTMSNHKHDGGLDRDGKYPKFLGHFHSLLARCLNVYLGHWENFWATEQSGALHLADGEALFDRMVYALTNAVQAHLVDKVANWPGVNSLAYQLADKPMVLERPKWFFDKEGKLPETIELRFVRPPEFAHLSQQQWADKLRAAVAEVEAKMAAERARTGKRVLGRKAILRQSPYSCPKSCTKRRGLNPRVATRNKWLRIELLQRKKRFQERYREAYERHQAGEADVLFPFGSYQLAMQGWVRCESSPALE